MNKIRKGMVTLAAVLMINASIASTVKAVEPNKTKYSKNSITTRAIDPHPWSIIGDDIVNFQIDPHAW